MTVVITKCPLCDWTHSEATHVERGALAGVFGYGTMRAVAEHQMRERAERATKEHVETHQLVQWVMAVRERDERVALVEQSLRKLAFTARTSGGTAGPDAGLKAACIEAERLLEAAR